MQKGFVCCVWLIGQLTCLGGGSQPLPPGAEKESNPKQSVPEKPNDERPSTEREIVKLIARLSEVENPYVGLSPSVSGRSFSAMTGTEKIEARVLTEHRLKTPEPLKLLVQLGPEALPYLLQALDDKTPSKLKFEPWKGFMNVGFPKDGQPYTVKVGDICYVALGQIIGRQYRYVNYIPSGTFCISSPVEDQELVKNVRAEWAKKEPAEQLREILTKEYQTKPEFNGESLDGWYKGSNLQIEAAMRLLYYYPKQGVPLVVARLKALDVADPGKQLEAWMRREVRNGVRTDEFIKAVTWCEHPDVRAALADLAKRTTDQEIAKLLKMVGVPKQKP